MLHQVRNILPDILPFKYETPVRISHPNENLKIIHFFS